ncbi:hypothetical protein V6N12_010259 [Hibiscus sabdariffa]|uniref:Uncharacterized protein n=1 Tax=Hibiscus sabdariffa TaxID=183260 RepID=A0ABR2B3V3_9ROSI
MSKVGPAVSTEVAADTIFSALGRFQRRILGRGGTVFVVKQDIKLVVVWRNMRDESNKVYIDITTDTNINWNFYKTKLTTSSSHAEATNLGYKATVDIDPNSVTPNLTAKLEQA